MYGSTDVTATPSSLASLKSSMVYHSGVGLPRLSCKRGCKMGVVLVVLRDYVSADFSGLYLDSGST